MRTKPTKLFLTPIQYYSPEINLYTFSNNKNRLAHFLYFPLYLPFWGEWSVTQGHDGIHTHIGDWGKAYDFMIRDNDTKTYISNGLFCEDYHCYNKPVLAPADGIVEEIVDNVVDNEIGQVNTTNNWGNTIIINHLPGLYTQISHLKKGTFKVKKGDFVKRGEVLANCGNSGRSPEPHIHFQVQTTGVVGSKTIEYPFAYYFKKEKKSHELVQFSKPQENEKISGTLTNIQLKDAFNLMPNSSYEFKYKNEKGTELKEQWDAYTDAYNNKYLYCKETESTAYYVNDSSMFYFTAFYGNKKSLLYYFYQTAYKVYLGNSENIEVKDVMPLSIIQNKKLSVWLHDFIAPFYNYFRVEYSIKTAPVDKYTENGSMILNSKIEASVFGKKKENSNSTIKLFENSISEFTYKSAKTNIHASCIKS